MNIRKIVTYNALRKQFTPEELIFADTLYNASGSERELLITALQPEKVVTKRAGRKSASKLASKSSRASGMAATIKGNLDQQRQVKVGACTFVLNNGAICNTGDNNPIHDQSFGYAGYHEFQPVASPVVHEASAGR